MFIFAFKKVLTPNFERIERKFDKLSFLCYYILYNSIIIIIMAFGQARGPEHRSPRISAPKFDERENRISDFAAGMRESEKKNVPDLEEKPGEDEMAA